MDIGDVLLVAAAVLGAEPDDVLEKTDIAALALALHAVPQEAEAIERAGALLHALLVERPFGDDTRAIALLSAAQSLEVAGSPITFTATNELFELLDRIESGTADLVDVCSYLYVEVSSMFERFTARARNVITHAYREAADFHHDWVGTEHLLLGVLDETDGIGADVLVSLGVDVDVVRREVEHRIGRGTEELKKRAPFTPRAKRVLELALREAIDLGHNYIGTEHILLGLLRLNEGVAAEILTDVYEIEIGRARNEVVIRLVSISVEPGSKGRRRSKPFVRPPVTWASPVDPAIAARRTRLLGDVQAVLDENTRLREEVARLRKLVDEHGIAGGEAGEQPA